MPIRNKVIKCNNGDGPWSTLSESDSEKNKQCGNYSLASVTGIDYNEGSEPVSVRRDARPD